MADTPGTPPTGGGTNIPGTPGGASLGAFDAGQVMVQLIGNFQPGGFDRFDQRVKDSQDKKAEAQLSAKVIDTGFREFMDKVTDAGRQVANATLGYTVQRRGAEEAKTLVDEHGRAISSASLGYNVKKEGYEQAKGLGDEFGRRRDSDTLGFDVNREGVTSATREGFTFSQRRDSERLGFNVDTSGYDRAKGLADELGRKAVNIAVRFNVEGLDRVRTQIAALDAELAKPRDVKIKADTDVASFARARGETDLLTKSHEGLSTAQKGATSSSKDTSSAMDSLKGATAIATSSITLMTTGILAAAPSVNALAGSVIALGGALGPASGAAAALAPAFLGVEAASKLTTDALKNVSKAVEGNEAAYKKLDPAQKAFVDQLRASGVQAELTAARLDSHRLILGGMSKAFDDVRPHMSVFTDVIHNMSSAVGDTIASFGRMLSAADSLRGVEALGREMSTTFRALGDAGVSLTHAFLTVSAAAEPLVNWLSGLVRQGAAWVDAATKSAAETGKLNEFFDHTRQILTILGEIVANVGVALFNTFKAGRESGVSLLSTLEDLTRRWRDWTASIAGQNELHKYFADAEQVTRELLGTLGALAEGIVKITHPTQQWADIWRDLHQNIAGPLITVLGNFINQVAPSLVRLVASVAQLLLTFTSIVPTIAPILDLLNSIVRGMIQLVDTVPGLKQLIEILGGVALAIKGIEIASAPIRGVIGILKELQLGFAGVETSAVAASAATGERGFAQNAGLLASRLAGRAGLTGLLGDLGSILSRFVGPAGLLVLAGTAFFDAGKGMEDLREKSDKTGGVTKVLSDYFGILKDHVLAYITPGGDAARQMTNLGESTEKAKNKVSDLNVEIAKTPEGFVKFAEAALTNFNAVGRVGPAQIGLVVDALDKLPPAAQGAGATTFLQMAEAMEKNGRLPVGATERLVGAINLELGKPIQEGATTGQQMAERLASAIETSQGRPKEAANLLAQGVTRELIPPLPNQAWNAGTQMAQRLADAIRAGIPNTIPPLIDLTQAAKDRLQNLPIVGNEAGAQTPPAVGTGIRNHLRDVEPPIDDLRNLVIGPRGLGGIPPLATPQGALVPRNFGDGIRQNLSVPQDPLNQLRDRIIGPQGLGAIPPLAPPIGARIPQSFSDGMRATIPTAVTTTQSMGTQVVAQFDTMHTNARNTFVGMMGDVLTAMRTHQSETPTTASQIGTQIHTNFINMRGDANREFIGMMGDTHQTMISHQEENPTVAEYIHGRVNDRFTALHTDAVNQFIGMMGDTHSTMVAHQEESPTTSEYIRSRVVDRFNAQHTDVVNTVQGMVGDLNSNYVSLQGGVNEGMDRIGRNTNAALSSFGAPKINLAVVEGAASFSGSGPHLVTAAQGGPIGRRGMKGPDDMLIVAGEGEYVLTSHMQPAVDEALKGMFGFGLNDLQEIFPHPHSHEEGGFVSDSMPAMGLFGDLPHFQGGGPITSIPTEVLQAVSGPNAQPPQNLGQSGLDKAHDAANQKLQEELAKLMSGGFPVLSGELIAIVAQLAALRGWNVGDWLWIISHESGGNPNARNPSSGAFGIGQFLPMNYNAYGPAGPGTSVGQQLAAMANYIAQRYGNPTNAKAFWVAHNWYERGGPVQKMATGGFTPGGPPVPGAGWGGDWPMWDQPEMIYNGIPLWDTPEPWIPVPKGSSWQRLPLGGGLTVPGDPRDHEGPLHDLWVLAANKDLFGDPDDAFWSLVTGKPGRPGGNVGLTAGLTFGPDTRREPSSAGIVGSGNVGLTAGGAREASLRGTPIVAKPKAPTSSDILDRIERTYGKGLAHAPGTSEGIEGPGDLYRIISGRPAGQGSLEEQINTWQAVIQQLGTEYGFIQKQITQGGVTTPAQFKDELFFQGLITKTMQDQYNRLKGAVAGGKDLSQQMTLTQLRQNMLSSWNALRGQQLDVAGMQSQFQQQGATDLTSFNQQRAALFAQGQNFVSPFASGIGAGGARYFGADSPPMMAGTQTSQGHYVYITNNFASPPPDAMTWAQMQAWEAKVAL